MPGEREYSIVPRTKDECFDIVDKSFEIKWQKEAPFMRKEDFLARNRFSFLAYLKEMLYGVSGDGKLDIELAERVLKSRMGPFYKEGIFENAKTLFEEGDWDSLLQT
jgi:hypothetical protein